MSINESITLFGIMVALAAIPSTSVALVVTRSATLGVGNGLSVSVGIVLGDLVFIALAIFGLSVVAETLGSFFMVIKVLGGFYLLWLGFSLLTAKRSESISVNENNSKGNLIASFLAGFLLTLGDIKAIIFYASLLPIFIDLSVIEAPEILTIVLITILSVGGVKVLYAIFANKVATNTKSTKMENVARKTAGGFMIGAGGYLIVKA
ncbi:MAG: LysE family translocator [Candidatus Thiodiazotropha taylori]|nr:LysE family translocator [Candidatus Thiodiazotropha taylori]